MADTNLLSPILTTQTQLQSEARKRKDPFDHISVKKGTEEEYYEDGWVHERELKIKTKLRKSKNIDEILENRCWLLMHMLNYSELNEGRQFTIEIRRRKAEPLRKQIDIFAKDDETVIVGECKASTKPTRRSLQKDIEEFANLKGPISDSIKKHYGSDYKLKIIWIFFTNNVIWSKPDIERAKGEHIYIVTEKELRYFSQIANHLRGAARPQFLAEFLHGQKIPGLENTIVPAIRGKLGGQKFYCFVTTPKQMLKISFVNHRSLNDPEGAPTYQRLMTKTRLRQIGNFLKKGGFFPTNILVNFTSKIRFDLMAKQKKPV